jgi:hypothetical protein
VRVTVDDIPPEMLRLLDERAGRAHTPGGQVVTTLVDLLNLWEQHVATHRLR